MSDRNTVQPVRNCVVRLKFTKDTASIIVHQILYLKESSFSF